MLIIQKTKLSLFKQNLKIFNCRVTYHYKKKLKREKLYKYFAHEKQMKVILYLVILCNKLPIMIQLKKPIIIFFEKKAI